MAGLPLVSNQYAAQTTATASSGGGFSLGKMLLGAAVIGGGIFLGLKTSVGKNIAKSIGNLVADNAGGLEKALVKGGKEGKDSAMTILKKGVLDADSLSDIIRNNVDEAISDDHIKILANTLANTKKGDKELSKRIVKELVDGKCDDFSSLITDIQNNALARVSKMANNGIDADRIAKLFNDYSLKSEEILGKLKIAKLGDLDSKALAKLIDEADEQASALTRILNIAKEGKAVKFLEENSTLTSEMLKSSDSPADFILKNVQAWAKKTDGSFDSAKVVKGISEYGVDSRKLLSEVNPKADDITNTDILSKMLKADSKVLSNKEKEVLINNLTSNENPILEYAKKNGTEKLVNLNVGASQQTILTSYIRNLNNSAKPKQQEALSELLTRVTSGDFTKVTNDKIDEILNTTELNTLKNKINKLFPTK